MRFIYTCAKGMRASLGDFGTLVFFRNWIATHSVCWVLILPLKDPSVCKMDSPDLYIHSWQFTGYNIKKSNFNLEN